MSKNYIFTNIVLFIKCELQSTQFILEQIMKYSIVLVWLFLCSVALANDLETLKTPTQKNDSLFTQEEKQYLDNKKVIKMCIMEDSKPVESFENGNHQGIVGDIFTVFQSYLPIPIQFIPINNFQEAQKNISNGTCDIKSIVIRESIPYQFLLTTDPYLTDKLVLITTNDEPFINSLDESFKDKKLVVRNVAYRIS